MQPFAGNYSNSLAYKGTDWMCRSGMAGEEEGHLVRGECHLVRREGHLVRRGATW